MRALCGGTTISKFTAGRKNKFIGIITVSVLLLDQATKVLVDQSLPLYRSIPIIDGFFDKNPRIFHTIWACVGATEVDHAQLEGDLEPLRSAVAKYLCPDGSLDTGPVNNRNCQSEIRAYLLHAWLQKARDPAHKVCTWLWNGAPAGIAVPFADLDGIMPRVDGDDPEFAAEQLWTD